MSRSIMSQYLKYVTLFYPSLVKRESWVPQEFVRIKYLIFSSVSLVAQSCPALCNPSTPGFPVHHQFPKLALTHVNWVGDAIQLSHPLSSPYLPNLMFSDFEISLFPLKHSWPQTHCQLYIYIYIYFFNVY